MQSKDDGEDCVTLIFKEERTELLGKYSGIEH